MTPTDEEHDPDDYELVEERKFELEDWGFEDDQYPESVYDSTEYDYYDYE